MVKVNRLKLKIKVTRNEERKEREKKDEKKEERRERKVRRWFYVERKIKNLYNYFQ